MFLHLHLLFITVFLVRILTIGVLIFPSIILLIHLQLHFRSFLNLVFLLLPFLTQLGNYINFLLCFLSFGFYVLLLHVSSVFIIRGWKQHSMLELVFNFIGIFCLDRSYSWFWIHLRSSRQFDYGWELQHYWDSWSWFWEEIQHWFFPFHTIFSEYFFIFLEGYRERNNTSQYVLFRWMSSHG